MKDKALFHFKQFSISHSQSTMKVGTDAVLLGAWAPLSDPKYILDIGTGCGIIALMMAQRSIHAQITGIDIDALSIREATANCKNSAWYDRLKMINVGLEAFDSPNKFDLIVSNPPFFQDGTLSPIESRKNARHTNLLTFDSLIKHSSRLLTADGKFAVILPSESEEAFIKLSIHANLYPEKITYFKPKQDKRTERVLLRLSKKSGPIVRDSLIHYDNNHEWSEDYIGLTKEFYVKL